MLSYKDLAFSIALILLFIGLGGGLIGWKLAALQVFNGCRSFILRRFGFDLSIEATRFWKAFHIILLVIAFMVTSLFMEIHATSSQKETQWNSNSK